MSDTSDVTGWFKGSDGNWYHPVHAPPPPGSRIPAAYSELFAPHSTNGSAIASFVLALVWLAGFGSILAVILGLSARKEIREAHGAQGGEVLAIAGILIGILGVVSALVFWIAIARLHSLVNIQINSP